MFYTLVTFATDFVPSVLLTRNLTIKCFWVKKKRWRKERVDEGIESRLDGQRR